MRACARDLISLVANWKLNPDKAECALNALRFSGLATDSRIHRELLARARDLFPEAELALAAKAEMFRVREGKHRMPAKVRLLKGIAFAMLRKGKADGLAFVDSIQQHFSNTPLALDISEARKLEQSSS